MAILRNYQDRDLRDINERFENLNSLLYVCPTGGGKSVLCSNFVDEKLKDNKSVLILAHRKQLIDQMDFHLSNKNIRAGKIIGKIEENLDSKVLVCSINTVTREKRLKTILEKNFDYIVVDEAHRIMSASYNNVITEIKKIKFDVKLLGLTATPIRTDKGDLRNYFEDLVISDDIATLTKNGYLAKCVTYSTPVINLDEEVDKNSNDYKLSSLSEYMKNPVRINFAVNSYKEKGENRQMLVFCVDVDHAKKVVEAYKLAGFDSIDYVDGDTLESKRQDILNQYSNNKLKIIVSIETMIEGVDLPETKCIQSLRPTKSLTIYMQLLGRGLRPKADKSNLIFLDCAGNSNTFGLIQSEKSWSLDPNHDPCKPREGNKVVGKKADGTYEEDLDAAEFLELEEMSYEEYLDKVINNEENAVKHNKTLEEKIIIKINDISDFIIRELGYKAEFEKILADDINDEPEIIIKGIKYELWSSRQKTVTFRFSNKNFLIADYQFYNSFDDELDRKQAIRVINVVKAFHDKVDNDKVFKNLLTTKFHDINMMKKQFIDINKIKNKKEEIKKELFLKELDEALKINKTFKITRKDGQTLNSWNFFPLANGWFNSITFESNSLKYSNSITLHDKSFIAYASKSVKKEKLIEIFEKMDFKIIPLVEEIVEAKEEAKNKK